VAAFNISDEFLRAGEDVAGWAGVRGVTACGHFGTVLGGYNQLGRSSFLRKTFSGLCKHNRISIAFGFVAIDGWKGESAVLYIDGNEGGGSRGSKGSQAEKWQEGQEEDLAVGSAVLGIIRSCCRQSKASPAAVRVVDTASAARRSVDYQRSCSRVDL
jgi:hypothetical protein